LLAKYLKMRILEYRPKDDAENNCSQIVPTSSRASTFHPAGLGA
jgi:hypothetical protein